MPINPKIRIGEGGVHGHCWFAKVDIPAGEWLWKEIDMRDTTTEILLTHDQVQALPPDQYDTFMALAYQADHDHMRGFDPNKTPCPEELAEYWVNHSCDGNAWHGEDTVLVAMRDIAAGEEITYDYALTETHPSFVLPKCLCGTAKCRGRITGSDWQRPDLQQRYGRHFVSHVHESIDEFNRQQEQLQKQQQQQQQQPQQQQQQEVAAQS